MTVNPSAAAFGGLYRTDAGRRLRRLGKLYETNRKGGLIMEAACRAHSKRKFFDLARLNKVPIAAEAVKRIDVLFAIEREINDLTPREAPACAPGT